MLSAWRAKDKSRRFSRRADSVEPKFIATDKNRDSLKIRERSEKSGGLERRARRSLTLMSRAQIITASRRPAREHVSRETMPPSARKL